MARKSEEERILISQRTKAALEERKKRGIKLGNPNLDQVRNKDTSAARKAKIKKAEEYQKKVWKEMEPLLEKEFSLERIADWLDAEACIPTIRGKRWTKTGVRRIIKKYNRN